MDPDFDLRGSLTCLPAAAASAWVFCFHLAINVKLTHRCNYACTHSLLFLFIPIYLIAMWESHLQISKSTDRGHTDTTQIFLYMWGQSEILF